MAPVIAAAGLTAAAGLLQGLMQQEQARRAEKLAREEEARTRLAQAQQQQIGLAGQASQNEQGALANMLAALQRTVR